MKPRYRIRETEGFDNGVDLVRVLVVSDGSWPEANIWVHADGGCCCTMCSGPLVAMRSDCRHCKAAKRWLADEKRKSR